MPVTIDTRAYEQRWGHGPEQRSEVWCVMSESEPGWAQWLAGPYSHLAGALRPGTWHLIPVPQLDPDPGGFTRRI